MFLLYASSLLVVSIVIDLNYFITNGGSMAVYTVKHQIFCLVSLFFVGVASSNVCSRISFLSDYDRCVINIISMEVIYEYQIFSMK